jgi:putative protease
MKPQPELLAPAGSPAAVTAAVRAGADAVYLGTKEFNARRGADNFDDAALEAAIRYCRLHGVRVHITLNTLVSDAELSQAKDVIRHVCALGADVLILQDLGLAALAKQCAPDLARHASTQMSVQTKAGLALLKALGYSRAVLPRELTKAEIADLRASTDLELELFIHGALCMCVSGQCLMSAMLGSRSGNRGLCAQPCRLPFSADESERYDLSLKDLSLMDRLEELAGLGVDSFKIEGRMKRPEYVAAAVTNARAALSGKRDAAAAEALRAVFSRQGFTSGYYDNARSKEMFGVRTREDVTAATKPVLSSLARLYEKERADVPVSFELTIRTGETPTLTATARGESVTVRGNTIPEPAREKPLTKEGLTQRLQKCGGTAFYADRVIVSLDEGLIVPASEINALRRNALETLENALSSVKPLAFTDIQIPLHSSNLERNVPDRRPDTNIGGRLPRYRLRLESPAQIPQDLSNVENLYFPLECEEKLVEKVQNCPISLGVELPRGIFGREAEVERLLKHAKENGVKIAYCPTLDAVALAKKYGFEIHGGFALHCFNSLSAAVLEGLDVKSLTLSPELTLAQASAIETTLPRGLIAYGRLPLMLTRNCPIRNVTDCRTCGRSRFLTDRKGVHFPVRCRFGCAEILNAYPIWLADRQRELRNMDFLTFYFTDESRAAVDAVLDAYRKEKAAKGDFTRGLYYRGVE